MSTIRKNTVAHEIFESIHAVMHLFRARQHRVLRDLPHELTHMESRALGFFARHPGATLSDLAAHSHRDKGQLARLISTLRERGLLDARADETDRRSTCLQLSEAGRTAHETLHAQARRLAGVAVAGMTADECAQLLNLLGKVSDNLQAAD